MAKLTSKEIQDFKKIIFENLSEADLKEVTDKLAKKDDKYRKWIRRFELLLFYSAIGLICYNYGFGLALCIWMIQIAQTIGVVRAVANKKSLYKLFERQGKPVTIDSILEDAEDIDEKPGN